VEVPDLLQQHRSGYHLALVAHQDFKEPELARLKVNDLAGATNDRQVRSISRSEISEPSPPPSGRAAAERIHARQRLRKVKWLGDVVITACLSPLTRSSSADDVR
jgi:hypothetical protein